VIDLHLHTHYSDGRDSPASLVARCARAGIRTLAVTDHDTTGAWSETLAAARGAGLTFVPGVEITAILDGEDVHVLGYFPSPDVPLLESFLRDQRSERILRARAIVQRLGDLGIPIDIEPALRAAGEDPRRTIGRPLLADALVAAGHVASRNEAFETLLGIGRPAFVPRHGAPPHEVIETVTAAGGIASLAHPGLLQRDDLIPGFIVAGLPALEVFHSDHDPETTARYHRLATRSGLLVTGGSDFHGDTSGHYDTMLGRVLLPEDEYERFRGRLYGS
jgi:predicted metal-dependent phosphoesterase TrpH